MTPSTGPHAAPPDPDFEALAQFARRRSADRANPALTGEHLHSAFDRDLAAATTVSFDIFDTLVLRRVGHPRDVYLHLGAQPAFARHTFPQPVADLRAEAENRARRRAYEERGSGEVVLPEVYAAFCELAQLPASAAGELVAAEEAVELLLCRPNPALFELFHRARGSGKPMIALSDTYHRTAFLERLLDAVGTPLPAGSIFASSEWRINKQSGQLFEQVFGHLGLRPAEVLHIGDHPVSDHRKPRAMGARALLHGHHGGGHPHAVATAPHPRVQSLLRSHASFGSRSGPPRGTWWQLGHNTFGPLIVGYALWLAKRFREDRVDRAYFLLRDGEIFHRVFEALFGGSAAPPVRQVLLASRRAYVFPLLGEAPDFALPRLLVCSEARPVGEYLSRLGLPAGDFLDDVRACGFSSPTEPVDGRRDRPRLTELFSRPRVREALHRAALREREALLDYLRHHRVLGDGHAALVDLGWNGTVHKAVHLLAQGTGASTRISGYYLATFPLFRTFVPKDLRAESYLGGPDDADPVVRGLASAPQVLEVVCSSASGSLLHFARSEKGLLAVLHNNPASGAHLAALAEIHEGVVAFAREYRDTPAALRADEIPPALAVEPYLRLLTSPTKEEAAALGGLAHGDDFGTGHARYLARFRPGSRTPEDLWEDYQWAYWKAGMLNHPSSQGNRLRTLWWLMQP